MSQNLEIEFKNLLTENEFHLLLNHFQIKEEDFFFQENDYFDTPYFSLKALGCALRVRKKVDNFELTLKEPQAIGLLETNDKITEHQYQQMLNNINFPDGEVKKRLASLNINIPDIVHFGNLKTLRAETDYKDGLLVFDKSQYLNVEDFELEYEVSNYRTGESNFHSLLNHFQIPKRTTDNKIARFYKQKQRLNSK